MTYSLASKCATRILAQEELAEAGERERELVPPQLLGDSFLEQRLPPFLPLLPFCPRVVLAGDAGVCLLGFSVARMQSPSASASSDARVGIHRPGRGGTGEVCHGTNVCWLASAELSGAVEACIQQCSSVRLGVFPG